MNYFPFFGLFKSAVPSRKNDFTDIDICINTFNIHFSFKDIFLWLLKTVTITNTKLHMYSKEIVFKYSPLFLPISNNAQTKKESAQKD